MPFAQQRARTLPDALASGAASWADVDRAALRILATQLRFAAAVTEPPPTRDVVACAAHRALAREVAARSMVLLRNEGVLPLDPAGLRRLAVVGRLADLPNTGDHGSSDVRAPYVVTPLAGLRAALPDTVITADPAGADAAVVVVGYTAAGRGRVRRFVRPGARHALPAGRRPRRAGRVGPGVGQRAAVGRRRPGRRCGCTPPTRRSSGRPSRPTRAPSWWSWRARP